MAVSRQQAAGHQQSLREFRDALERLEKRIEQLER
jgi:phage shock protein A